MRAGELRIGDYPLTATERKAPPSSAQEAVAALSLRANFAWVFAGNVVYAACQWGMIVALAKLGNSFMVGQFSLGLAIATPVLMFSNFDLRAVQATDCQRQYRFAEYLRLRLVMTITALSLIVGIASFGNYQRRTALVIIAVALAKGIETLSDIHYGLFQLNGRLDQTGRSMMLRGLASLIALSAGLYLTHDVFWACVWLALAWLGSLLFFDIRRGRYLVALTEKSGSRNRGLGRHGKLLYIALPMGIVMTVASLNLHMPRYFIHAGMGEHQLGIFSALAYATIAMTLVGDSLAHCAIPRMSRLYAAAKLTEFRALLLRMFAVACAFGLAALALAQGIGERLLAVVYGADYAVHSRAFVLLMCAAVIHCVASMLTSGITSARAFRVQVPLYLLVAGTTAICCAQWVPTMGLVGAAFAVIAGAVMRLALAAVVIAWLLFGRRPAGVESRHRTWRSVLGLSL